MCALITNIIRNASIADLTEARNYVSNQLHIVVDSVDDWVAVAYIIKHFTRGQLEGWEGFVDYIHN